MDRWTDDGRQLMPISRPVLMYGWLKIGELCFNNNDG